MKRAVILIVSILLCFSAGAQVRSHRLGIGGAVLHERGLEADLVWEMETNYHNAWEVFANGYLKWQDGKISFTDDYYSWGIGAAYRPCVVRRRNNYGSMRFGASAGCDRSDFLAGLHVGYEHDYALPHGWMLYWQAKFDVMLPKREDLIRAGVGIGVKLPLSR